jgi:hypothetical protein
MCGSLAGSRKSIRPGWIYGAIRLARPPAIDGSDKRQINILTFTASLVHRQRAISSRITLLFLGLPQPDPLTRRPGIGMLGKSKDTLENLPILKHPDDPPIVAFDNLDPVARQYAKSQPPTEI